MGISSLDPNTALLVIDLQKGILAFPMVHPVDDVVERASTLVEAFRRHSRPVVFVTVAGGAPGRTERGHGDGELPPSARARVPRHRCGRCDD